MSKPAHRKIKRKINWKKYRNNPASPLKLGIAVLAFLVVLIIFSKLISGIEGLGQSFAPDSSPTTKKISSWDGSGPINLAVKSDQIYVLSFDPQQRAVTILKIPEEAYLAVPFGFGNWPARSIYELGQAEKPPFGAALLKETLQSTLGIPLEGYLLTEGQLSQKPLEKVVESIRQNPLNGLSLLSSSKTDLNLAELLKLVWGLKGVRLDKIKVLDLSQSQITSWILLPDKSRVLDIDEPRLDEYIQDKFADSQLRDQSVPIGIFNATNHPGLAEKAARLITNIGGRVIFTSNCPTLLSTSVVSGKPSYTLNRVAQIFALQPQKGSDKQNNFNTGTSRAEINLFLGEDFFMRYNNRK